MFFTTATDHMLSYYLQISLEWSLIASDDSDSWPSPTADFAFGFPRLKNQYLHLLSIWFDKIPNKTLVWYPNGDNLVPKRSEVELTRYGVLVLTDPGGNTVWSRTANESREISKIMMNFKKILQRGHFECGVVQGIFAFSKYELPQLAFAECEVS